MEATQSAKAPGTPTVKTTTAPKRWLGTSALIPELQFSSRPQAGSASKTLSRVWSRRCGLPLLGRLMFGLLLLFLEADEGQALTRSFVRDFYNRGRLLSFRRKVDKRPVLERQESALDKTAPNHIVATYMVREGKKYLKRIQKCRDYLRVTIQGGGTGTCSLQDEKSCPAGASEGPCFSKTKKPCSNEPKLPDFDKVVISSSKGGYPDSVQIWKKEQTNHRQPIIFPNEEEKGGDSQFTGKIVLNFGGRQDGIEHQLRCDKLRLNTNKKLKLEINSPTVNYSEIE